MKVWCHEFLKIFHIREDLMKKAGNISRKNLLSMGTCFGKMTKAGKFHLQITALDFMAPYAKVSKVLIGFFSKTKTSFVSIYSKDLPPLNLVIYTQCIRKFC